MDDTLGVGEIRGVLKQMRECASRQDEVATTLIWNTPETSFQLHFGNLEKSLLVDAECFSSSFIKFFATFQTDF